MSNKIVSASLALLLGWSGTAFAQSEVDALRYTQLGISGSARIQGIGGAQSALGADISSMFVNPAGLGMFRRSEITVSPGFSTANANTRIANPDSYFGPNVSDSRNSIGIPQAGIVFSERKADNDGSDWRGTSIGLSITRLNNFNQQISYRNTTEPPNTIVDYFAEQANIFGRDKVDLDAEYDTGLSTFEGLAYGTYLINFNDVYGNPTQNADPIYSLGSIDQQEQTKRRGSQNQFDIGVGTSYKEKLYLGASVGIISTNFEQERIFRESGYYIERLNENDEIESDGNYSLALRDHYTSRGAGINLKLGAIYRFNDALRLGASIQTPTSFSFDESYSTSLAVDYTGSSRITESIIPGQSSYGLTTPFRATGGLAYFINKYGFISADVEYVNYAGMRFRERDSDFGGSGNYFGTINTRIKDTYQSAVNVRIGAEARYEVFRFRAGYAHGGNPYKAAGLDGSTSTFSLGTGIRLQNYFVDVAYTNTSLGTAYSPYTFDTGTSPEIDIDNRFNNVVFTLGFNF
ncbi:hypothetical protein FVR03_00335 [Pontibacter qinzhouensis]|uniref:Transporter n=1 Tax=Pontibacter qinzhouensis TaxID=2603253 RepID=A0A5C8KBT0_9BACT|nr:hypothetical protein [Pontibacter qinzhouensis]TXK52856.1 hypothetical protein FVR03_00335 [Pontibacter qinzhouensis]